MSTIRKYHNHRLQINARHCEEEQHDIYLTSHPKYNKSKAISSLYIVTIIAILYLRNLLTHTVNNLQQTLYYVKLIQISVIKQNFNIIHTMYENFRSIPFVLCDIQPFQYKRVKTESHKNCNFRLKFAFQ